MNTKSKALLYLILIFALVGLFFAITEYKVSAQDNPNYVTTLPGAPEWPKPGDCFKVEIYYFSDIVGGGFNPVTITACVKGYITYYVNQPFLFYIEHQYDPRTWWAWNKETFDAHVKNP